MKKIKLNISKEKLDTIGKYAKKGCEIAGYIASVALSYVSVREIVDAVKYSGEVDYGDAVDAIMSSDMLSSYKEKAVLVLKKGEDSQFYKAIIKVAKSDMMSSYKCETIKKMCE